MLGILARPKYRDLFLGLALLCTGAALVLFPEQSMDAGRQGLQLCTNVIIPSLFPFFVLSSLVIELGMARYLGQALERLMWPLFRVGGVGASALVLGLVGGYPVGAQTAIKLYEKKLCSKEETQRLLAFCNNSGPAFILGVVGTGVFGSGAIGLLLYLSHAAACLCVGLLFRFYGKSTSCPTPSRSTLHFQTTRFSAALTTGIKTSFASVLNICAFVLFFSVVIRLLFLCGIMDAVAGLLATLLSPLGFDRVLARQLITGLLEVSSGVTSLSPGGGLPGQISMAAFMLGWAGLSVHCQVLSFLGDSGLSPVTYLIGKALHGALSAFFTMLLSSAFPLPQTASSYLAEQAETLATLDVASILPFFAASACLLWLLFLAASALVLKRAKKRSGNGRRYAL